MRENGTDELDSIRHQMVTLEPSFILFAAGRHAWYILPVAQL